jgi:hypothetical protein
MGILKTYFDAYPTLVKFSAGCPTEQSCPVMRALFTFTDHTVRGLEQIRILFPAFPVVRGVTAHKTTFGGFREKAHQCLEQAGVYKGLKEFHPFVEGALFGPDYFSVIGDIEPIKPWVESLKTPESLIDEDRRPIFDKLDRLLGLLDKATDEQARNILLEIRLTVEIEMADLSRTRDNLAEHMRQAENIIQSIREERQFRMNPQGGPGIPPGMRVPPGVQVPPSPTPGAPTARP